jgi:tetratricopeptide (TPR) repeat protein
LKNDTLALPYLNQAYSQDTTNTSVLYALALVNYNLGYFPEAIRHYTALVTRAMPNENVIFTYLKELGKSYEKNGSYEMAFNTFISAIPYLISSRKEMDLYYNLAVLCETGLKEPRMALDYYKKYRLALFNYQTNLKDEGEIELMKLKINELDKYTKTLQEQLQEN